MLKNRSPFDLGATLYMPILKHDALAYISGEKLPELRSLVLCLEDALLESDVLVGMDILERTLLQIGDVKRDSSRRNFPMLFIRPRHIEMAQRIAQMAGIHNIDGFVAPKVRNGDVEKWVHSIRGTDLLLMPTLETSEMFDAISVAELKSELLSHAPDRIIALRVGGNDLMSCLGVRRTPRETLYEGPLFYVVSMLMSVMGSSGFSLTSPVFEIIDDSGLLQKEVDKDVSFGFVGKTAIHPSQIHRIQLGFRPDRMDYDASVRILATDAEAVFKYGGSMCEPSTHRTWAQRILDRARIYGISEQAEIGV
ncbi:HpcH/HpaI aldolase/citrate lyase family protein [Mesorhizobium sp. M0808]|uniref:HpcH/HpaI aldolase/citrate lyase family protein n=1 Tax=unclassified Mesorhizobium TaxID=325217 RepID=UPI00333609F0